MPTKTIMVKMTDRQTEDVLGTTFYIGQDVLVIQPTGHRYEGTVIEWNNVYIRVKDYRSQRDCVLPWNNIAMVEVNPSIPYRDYEGGVDGR